jgi:hypothetical protein
MALLLDPNRKQPTPGQPAPALGPADMTTPAPRIMPMPTPSRPGLLPSSSPGFMGGISKEGFPAREMPTAPDPRVAWGYQQPPALPLQDMLRDRIMQQYRGGRFGGYRGGGYGGF